MAPAAAPRAGAPHALPHTTTAIYNKEGTHRSAPATQQPSKKAGSLTNKRTLPSEEDDTNRHARSQRRSNTRRSTQQTPRRSTNNSTCTAQGARMERKEPPASDLNLSSASGRKDPTSTFINKTRVLPLYIKWVLLSTIVLCGFTHHIASPPLILSMPHSVTYPPTYYPPLATPTLCFPNCLRNISSRFLQQDLSSYHQWPPPSNSDAPSAAMPPSTPTPHTVPHNEVRQNACHYQPKISNTKRHQKLQNRPSIGLPPVQNGRRSLPPHTASNYHLQRPAHAKPRNTTQ